MNFLEPERGMVRILRPNPIRRLRFATNIERRRFEEFSKLLSSLGLHALEGLCASGGVFGQGFFGKLGQEIV